VTDPRNKINISRETNTMDENQREELHLNHQLTYVENRHLISLIHETQSYSHCNPRYQTGLPIKTDIQYACILSRLPIYEDFIHRLIARNNPRIQIFTSAEMNHVHLRTPRTNSELTCNFQTKDSDPSNLSRDV
jgi:hypothetical protein